jgi:hypothetical protein
MRVSLSLWENYGSVMFFVCIGALSEAGGLPEYVYPCLTTTNQGANCGQTRTDKEGNAGA